MREFIKNQLDKVRSVQIDTSSNHIYIPKTESISTRALSLGAVYKIKLKSEYINNKDSAFSINWNNGRAPECEEYLAEVIELMSKYVKINGVSGSNNFYGWIPFEWIEKVTPVDSI